MFERIIKNLLKPQLIPGKLARKIQRFYIEFWYDEKRYIAEQVKNFQEMSLDYFGTVDELNDVYKDDSRIQVEMASHHHNLFVAFSHKYNFKNILEIGTHSGAGAVLLSKIFPDSKITTIDLPDNHPIFLDTYNRNVNKERLDFIKQRDELLSSSGNIEFKQINSLELTFSNSQYDLIWVDGAHGYPVVTVDIINSLRLVSEGGFVVCDDVFKQLNKSDDMYSSIASFETIQALSDAKLINYSLILKRTVKPWAHPRLRKYIAILTKR